MIDPCVTAYFEPTKRLPIEHIDRSKSELLVEGRNVGACTIGKTG